LGEFWRQLLALLHPGELGESGQSHGRLRHAHWSVGAAAGREEVTRRRGARAALSTLAGSSLLNAPANRHDFASAPVGSRRLCRERSADEGVDESSGYV